LAVVTLPETAHVLDLPNTLCCRAMYDALPTLQSTYQPNPPAVLAVADPSSCFFAVTAFVVVSLPHFSLLCGVCVVWLFCQ
jgi:hypothetical protein